MFLYILRISQQIFVDSRFSVEVSSVETVFIWRYDYTQVSVGDKTFPCEYILDSGGIFFIWCQSLSIWPTIFTWEFFFHLG